MGRITTYFNLDIWIQPLNWTGQSFNDAAVFTIPHEMQERVKCSFLLSLLLDIGGFHIPAHINRPPDPNPYPVAVLDHFY